MMARNSAEFIAAIAAARGGTLELKVVRGTDERTIQVALTSTDQPAQDA